MANTGNGTTGNGSGNGWQPQEREATDAGSAEEARRRIEDCARRDAYDAYEAIQRREMWIPPDGDLWPLAVEATYTYLDRLRQESQAFPRWTRTTGAPLDTMRDYWQWIGDRYSEAFVTALSYHCALYTRTERRVIPTLPLVAAIATAQAQAQRPQRGQSRQRREA